MPDLLEKLYCSEQISIPPTFPYIMKLYCKAAIRTQPYDLLKWSAAYFRALANGEEPPVKERVEYPPYDSPCGLTPGYIKVLINQFGKNPETNITVQTLFQKWSDICLQEELLVKLIALMGSKTVLNWVNFVGVCAGFISKSLTQTMVLVCELFTEEPEGGMASVPYTLFIDIYMFLASMECGSITEAEQAEIDGIVFEEDICDVSDKIKRGIYEGEGGEYDYEEDIRSIVIPYEGEEEDKSTLAEEEQEIKKVTDLVEKESIATVAVLEEEEPEKSQSEDAKEPEKQDDTDESSVYSGYSLNKLAQSSVTVGSEEAEGIKVPFEEESVREEEKEVKPEPEEKVSEVTPKVEAKPKPKKIVLEDMEESIRMKIEEKLAQDKESVEGEDIDKEFDNLSSYLLGAAARVQKLTAEQLGYKIFKKYLRQDVPGIGPSVGREQIESVVDFMDFWSHKQENMVMPRNIRHWMCPPLDKIPISQP